MNEEKTSSESRPCKRCGMEIDPADAPLGLCPRCLLLGAEDEREASANAPHIDAPTVEALDRALDRYDVLELIGTGGMGAVYRARQTGLDRLVAIKVLPAAFSNDPHFAERFRREARVMARLDHPNIVRVLDFGETDSGLFYIAMDYVEGTDLNAVIRNGDLDPKEALHIVAAICDALQYAHDKGFVHRDIKPANILLDTSGRVRVGDFGLARLTEVDPFQATLTHTGATLGTPSYMAPEQFAGSGKVDHRADIYSLGVMFYEMLTGEIPRGAFDPPSAKVNIDVRLDEVVIRSLKTQPEVRYQQASAVKADIEEISTGAARKPQRAAAEEAATRGRRWVRWAVLAVLLLLGIPIASLFAPQLTGGFERRTDGHSAADRARGDTALHALDNLEGDLDGMAEGKWTTSLNATVQRATHDPRVVARAAVIYNRMELYDRAHFYAKRYQEMKKYTDDDRLLQEPVMTILGNSETRMRAYKDHMASATAAEASEDWHRALNEYAAALKQFPRSMAAKAGIELASEKATKASEQR